MGRLGEVLVADRAVSESGIARALGFQRFAGSGMRLGTILLGWDLVDEDVLLATLSRIHRCPSVGWPELSRADSSAVGLLSPAAARTLRAMPYGWSGRSLQVAFANPSDLKGVDELAALLRRRILAAVTTEIRILQSHQLYYGYGLSAEVRPILFKLDRRTRTKAIAAALPEPLDRLPFSGQTYPLRPAPAVDEIGGVPEASKPAPAPVERPSRPAVPLGAVPAPPREAPADAEPEHRPEPDAPIGEVSDAAAEREVLEDLQARSRTADDRTFAAPDLWLEPLAQEAAPASAVQATASRSPRDVADELLKALLADFQRVAILRAGRRGISGWGQRGRSVLTDHFVEVDVPWTARSIFSQVRETAEPHFGPLSADQWPKALSPILGGSPPPCAIFPVFVRDQVGAFLYADRIGAPLQHHDYSLLSRAAAAAGTLLGTVELEDGDGGGD